MERPYTTIKVSEAISAGDASLFVQHGDKRFALDGLDGKSLRGIAKMLERAADIADDCFDLAVDHGPTNFSLSYEIEWGDRFRPWSVDDNFEADGTNKHKF